MPRRTREEYEAAAMLLGMWYDFHDHTYNSMSDHGYWDNAFDPETMESLDFSVDGTGRTRSQYRREMVERGELPPEIEDANF